MLQTEMAQSILNSEMGEPHLQQVSIMLLSCHESKIIFKPRVTKKKKDINELFIRTHVCVCVCMRTAFYMLQTDAALLLLLSLITDTGEC